MMDANVVSIDLTRPWKDGGRDGLGNTELGLLTPISSSISLWRLSVKVLNAETVRV